MDFAKKILSKYGWKEGEGLGKNSDGIAKPIKASMKFDNCGLGSDQAASDFNNHWWERVFNEAAANVEVKRQENDRVAMNLKNEEDGVEISTKGYSVRKLKKAKQRYGSDGYDNFLQSATLTGGGDEVENPNKIEVTDIAVTQLNVLTDDELFRACGGRTAHKGARHGLKLSGKLSRLEQQEKELLMRMQEKMANNSVEKQNGDDFKVAEKNKKKSKVEEALGQNECEKRGTDSPNNNLQALQGKEIERKEKKKKKKSKRKLEEPKAEDATTHEPQEPHSKKLKKSKKKRKLGD